MNPQKSLKSQKEFALIQSAIQMKCPKRKLSNEVFAGCMEEILKNIEKRL